MYKRTFKEARRDILKVLNDGKEHSFASLERKTNTNWKTVRLHCENLELFKAITISKENKVRITKIGKDILKEIE